MKTKKHLSEEHKRKISEAHKGKKLSEEHKKNLSISHKGKTTWMKGKHHKPESIKKMLENGGGFNKTSFKRGHKLSKASLKKKNLSMKLNAKTNPNYGMKGKHHTKKFRERYKEMRKNWIVPTKDTTIEVKIQNFLKQLGIEFFTHQQMKINHSYQCDVFIPSMKLVIECDGDYWHKYPIGKDLDHIRTKELIEKGFKVLRLWEFEIRNMDIIEFKERLSK